MQYRVTPSDSQRAGYPHSFFILNLIIVHLFASYTMLELGYGDKVIFIPLVSLVIMSFLWLKAKKKIAEDHWFVGAHWLLMTKRIRTLIIFYIVGAIIGGFTYFMVSMSPLKGDDVATIGLRMGAVPVFLGLLVTFVLSGGSIFDAQRGTIGHKIVEDFPPPADLEVISDAEGASSENADTTPQDHIIK